ncbi:HBS1-like protein [Gracilariopsis chorda]|uniref:HBS1-like protein n=1 Tax=Gracilariopsis chorda TaxID=448386 RepID=A0A2V3IMJ2_9FLOR|nr:HBS1-like protein [Gracilariopsis chorda]|eukprot:PXF43298.1 HBS1-like protein [Gracilariopsis chorda]
MSRHRHIRNLRYEDYMDDDDYYDDDYLEEEEEEEQPYAYQQHPSDEQHLSENPDGIFEDLVQQFRVHLQDDTISAAEVDAAITAANYDIENAIQQLRSQRLSAQQRQQKQLEKLELKNPSNIGQLLSHTEESQPLPLPPQSEVDVNQLELSGFSTFVHLTPPSQCKAKPYAFDDPSPDDVIASKQKKANSRAQSIRMPKLSMLRVTPSPSTQNTRTNETSVSNTKNGASSSRNARTLPIQTAKKNKAKNAAKPKSTTSAASDAMKSVEVQRSKKIDISQIQKKGSSSIPVVIAGHVDAGKSTLLGHFLKQISSQTKSNSKRRKPVQNIAWETDEDGVERERGVTIDIATRVFKRKGRTYALIDAPGHRDFVPAMILGASQASAAILVVDSSPGEFESGFSENGQTREHTLVLKALGINRLIVVINKMDMVSYSKARFLELKKKIQNYLGSNGWKTAKSVSFIAVSGKEGVNLISSPDTNHPLSQWYDGKCLLDELESLDTINASIIEEDSKKPTRFVVSDFFRSVSLGGDGAVTGRLLCGSIAPKDRLVLCPGGAMVTVKTVERSPSLRTPVAVAGVDTLPVSLGLQNLTDGLLISAGNVLCDPQKPVKVAVTLRAQLVTTAFGTVLVQGTCGVLHIGGGTEAATITGFKEYVHTKRGGKNAKKRIPRRLVKGDIAIVEITCNRGVAMEKSTDVKGLGRFAFRQNGETLAVGIVEEIVQTAEENGAKGAAAIDAQ